MSSHLLYEPNHALCAFTATLELQFHISDSRDKIVQNVKILHVRQNSDLNLKLNPTRQHESRGILSFQNRTPNIKLLKFHAIETIGLTSKNTIFSGSSFTKFETGLKTSPKMVSDSDSESRLALHAKLDKAFNCQFHKLSRKIWLFKNNFKHRHIIYCWKAFCATSMNSRSLLQNKAPFDSN